MALRFVRWRFALLLWLAPLLASPLAHAQESSPLVRIHIDSTIVVYHVATLPDAPHADTIYFWFKRATHDTAVWRIGAWIAPSATGTLETDSAPYPQVDTTGHRCVAELWNTQVATSRSRYGTLRWPEVESQPAGTPPCSTGTMLHPLPAVFDGEENPATFEAVDDLQ